MELWKVVHFTSLDFRFGSFFYLRCNTIGGVTSCLLYSDHHHYITLSMPCILLHTELCSDSDSSSRFKPLLHKREEERKEEEKEGTSSTNVPIFYCLRNHILSAMSWVPAQVSWSSWSKYITITLHPLSLNNPSLSLSPDILG